MRDQRICPTPSDDSPADEDRIIQSAVLLNVVALHPVQLTKDELIREMATEPVNFGQRDRIARAVRDLIKVGLLHRHGDFILPTRAALSAYELWD